MRRRLRLSFFGCGGGGGGLGGVGGGGFGGAAGERPEWEEHCEGSGVGFSGVGAAGLVMLGWVMGWGGDVEDWFSVWRWGRIGEWDWRVCWIDGDGVVG